ncbi:MAG: helix-turn-helix domain-containing protein [Candidatus Anammoxibacter sp.]
MYNLTMNEISKYKTIKEVIEGYLKAEEASKILGISERQVYRIKSRGRRRIRSHT